MSNPVAHFRWFLQDGVAVVELVTHEINQPELARELGAQLNALLDGRASDRVLLDFHKTKYMSSTGFATLFELTKTAKAAGIKLAICAMDPAVRVGADILSLGRFIPIFQDKVDALATLQGIAP